MNSRRFVISLYAVVFVGLGLCAGAVLIDSRAEFAQQKRREVELRRVRLAKEAQLRENERILQRLDSDPQYVERVLRKRLNWAEPGETVYTFPDFDKAPVGGPRARP